MKKETIVRVTKYLLEFMYYAGIVVTVSLPWSVKFVAKFPMFSIFEDMYNEIIISYFALGILATLILGELRKMFRTIMADDCFVQANVVSLQRMGTYSFIIALICLVRAFILLTLPMLVFVLVFTVAGLFSKVLALVFEKAVNYKLENDFTI